MNTEALMLGPELTIAFAAAERERLSEALKAPGDLQLDLAAVTEFDSAGVQLLLAARRSLAAREARLQLVGASPVVRDALTVFGLQSLLAGTH